MIRRIILSGVHGVGKGYFLDRKIRNKYDVMIMSASEIISNYRETDDGKKRVDNVNLNQQILSRCLSDFFIKYTKNFILDGHLVLLNNQNQLERIPLSFFKKGMFDTIFLLQDNPTQIYKRLYKRDGLYKLDIETISFIQSEELKYSREIEKNGINVVYLTPDSDCSLYDIYLTEKGTKDAIL